MFMYFFIFHRISLYFVVFVFCISLHFLHISWDVLAFPSISSHFRSIALSIPGGLGSGGGT